MKSFEECMEIARKKAEAVGVEITKAYSLGNGYVFDNDEEYLGVLPIVVDRETGETWGLWAYLNTHNLTMDDMVQVQMEGD